MNKRKKKVLLFTRQQKLIYSSVPSEQKRIMPNYTLDYRDIGHCSYQGYWAEQQIICSPSLSIPTFNHNLLNLY